MNRLSWVNVETGERISNEEHLNQCFPLKPPTPEEEKEERIGLQALLEEEPGGLHHFWVRRIMRVYLALDMARSQIQSLKSEFENEKSCNSPLE